MTAQTRTVLKGSFEQGDTPQGTDYVDLIDSFLSLSDSSAQSVISPVIFSGTLGVQTVSAVSLQAVTVSGGVGNFDTLLVGGEAILPPSQSVSVGEMFLLATAAAVPSAAGSFSILSGTFSAVSVLLQDMSASPTLAEIEYTGTATAKFYVTSHMSVGASANNKLSAFRIGVNASSLSRTEIRRLIGTGADVGAMTIGSSVILNPNDKVSLMCTNVTDTVGLNFVKTILHVQEE